jgi:hypothetical protein
MIHALAYACKLVTSLKKTLCSKPNFSLQALIQNAYHGAPTNEESLVSYITSHNIKFTQIELRSLAFQYSCTSFGYKDLAKIILPNDVVIANMAMQLNTAYAPDNADLLLLLCIIEV